MSTPALVSVRLRGALLVTALAVTLGACSSDGSEPASPLRTGVFLDSAVEGLSYDTPTMSGVTGAAGEFGFNAGEMVRFSIGSLQLPEVPAANTITPMDIFAADDLADTRVVNLSRLLQSLDLDGDPDNGITLPRGDLVDSLITADTIDIASDGFDAQAIAVLTELVSSTPTLVDANTASAHLMQTLIDNDLLSSGCTSEHPSVGLTGELSTIAHGVSGSLTVLDDCTIEVRNFNYDGGGPSVYFYAALDGNYSSPSAILGPRLDGQQWVNDTLRLSLPDGVSLDDFNSLSVWCRDFHANFGEVFLGSL